MNQEMEGGGVEVPDRWRHWAVAVGTRIERPSLGSDQFPFPSEPCR